MGTFKQCINHIPIAFGSGNKGALPENSSDASRNELGASFSPGHFRRQRASGLPLLFSKAKLFDRLSVCQLTFTCVSANKGLLYQAALG